MMARGPRRRADDVATRATPWSARARAMPLPARTPTLLPVRPRRGTEPPVPVVARAAPHPKYERGERIGCGGMAEVFRGIAHGAEGFARPIAIKRMLPMLSDLPELAALFVREARIASRLLHPNVVAVHDFDRDDEDRHFLVMELVEGVSLDQLMEGGPLPPAIACFVACEALRGLAHAHAAGIVHRDASPHNVLLGWDGAVKVADFGIASVRAATPSASADALRGKPGYLAPEQTRGGPVDARADVFVIGIALWGMLAGERIALDKIVRPRARRPAIPAALDAVVMRMLASAPADRPASAEAAIAALAGVQLGGGSHRDPRTALAQLLSARFSRTSRRKKPMALAVARPRPRPSQLRYRLLVAVIISCTLIGIAVGVLAGTR
jgi:serine/threonine-protein kinase